MVKHIRISGRVQGVGFRHFIKKNADRIGINGWVKNCTDGTVEALFSGEEDKVRQMLQLSKRGPAAAYVKEVKVIEKGSIPDYLSGFEVRT